MTDRVVVAGDVHLGSANADAEAFDGFLDALLDRPEAPTEVVLLGDVWDLVRRDPFGCAWETSGTIERLRRLAEAVPVHVVLGNHDSYLRALDGERYGVTFHEAYVRDAGPVSVRFCHGNAFDRLQFDALSARLSGPGDRGEIDPTRGRKDAVAAAVRRGVGRARSRLPGEASPYSRRERRAHAHLDAIPEAKLVYGHTHAPYVHHDNVAANPGSWKTTAPVHDTYLVVEDGDIALYRYRPDAPDERLPDRPGARPGAVD